MTCSTFSQAQDDLVTCSGVPPPPGSHPAGGGGEGSVLVTQCEASHCAVPEGVAWRTSPLDTGQEAKVWVGTLVLEMALMSKANSGQGQGGKGLLVQDPGFGRRGRKLCIECQSPSGFSRAQTLPNNNLTLKPAAHPTYH